MNMIPHRTVIEQPHCNEARNVRVKPDSLFPSLLDIAMEHIEQGVSVIPVRLDGSKGPAISAWKQYQDRLPTIADVRQWFQRPAGMAVICGLVSGGLEVIDFDGDATRIFPQWQALVSDIVCRLPIVETPSGGYHVYYRSEVICGNQKIATDRNAEKQTLIETRGQGGYVVSCSSPAEVHALIYPYVQVAGPIIPEIPDITPAERLMLWQAGRRFDQDGLLKKEVTKAQPKTYRSNPIAGDEPWKAFNRSADWEAILRADGWSSGDDVHWTRPDKSSGTSATLREATSGVRVLVVFSSNAPVPQGTHSAASYLAYVRFGGCFKSACRAIRKGIQ